MRKSSTALLTAMHDIGCLVLTQAYHSVLAGGQSDSIAIMYSGTSKRTFIIIILSLTWRSICIVWYCKFSVIRRCLLWEFLHTH